MPASLPEKATIIWKHELASRGLGGVSATNEYVIISDRELDDTLDVFKCLRADTGKLIWTVRYPAPGNLDYGNSPRASPVIANDLVYLHGAFGSITCVQLATGKSVWELNTTDEFEPEEVPRWGTCSTPLLVEGKLIVNPGAKNASLVALDAKTGKVLWKSPGRPAGYGSFILANIRGQNQIVGHDKDSLGGWDPNTGKRLWRLVPDRPNDFNVPTPIQVGERLLVTTENNGTRLYEFDEQRIIKPKSVAINRDLAPDTHTPVVASDRVFGVWRKLYCLDLKAGLKAIWEDSDTAFQRYCAVVTDGHRVLVLTMNGELILLDATSNEFKQQGRLKLLNGENGVYSHPAFVGSRMYVRAGQSVMCVELGAGGP